MLCSIYTLYLPNGSDRVYANMQGARHLLCQHTFPNFCFYTIVNHGLTYTNSHHSVPYSRSKHVSSFNDHSAYTAAFAVPHADLRLSGS